MSDQVKLHVKRFTGYLAIWQIHEYTSPNKPNMSHKYTSVAVFSAIEFYKPFILLEIFDVKLAQILPILQA
jgi:hypothetical protein